MERNQIKRKTMFQNQRVLFPLIVLAALVAVLGVTCASKPVHASRPPDQWITPGDGGGSYPTYDIQGQIFNIRTGEYASGVKVRIYSGTIPYNPIATMVTDGVGYFRYHDTYYVEPYTWYKVTVNGAEGNLGESADDGSWCQWYTEIQTDGMAHACVYVNLEPSTTVAVAAAALYSHSAYATLGYSQADTNSFQHSVSFNVATFGVSTGYMSGTTCEHHATCLPSYSVAICKAHYAITYCNAHHNTYRAGLVNKQGEYWGTVPITDYVSNPSNLDPQYCYDFPCSQGGPTGGSYTETESNTWSVNAGPPLEILFGAYGKSISIDVTVRSETDHTNQVRWDTDISNSGHTTIYFRVYRRVGEIHIWETGWA